MATRKSSASAHTTTDPTTRAGDRFFAASLRPDLRDETPHGCIDGWVYLGFEGEDENGEHVEELERVPCCRCHGENL
jgi:hypothetical protein